MIKLGDVQETALIPLAVRAEETKRKNARIHDFKAVKIIDELGVDTKNAPLSSKKAKLNIPNRINRQEGAKKD